jgi:hypothetical protein
VLAGVDYSQTFFDAVSWGYAGAFFDDADSQAYPRCNSFDACAACCAVLACAF